MNEVTLLSIEKTCKDCNKPFTINKGEIQFLESKGLAIYERCKECRKKRREANERRS